MLEKIKKNKGIIISFILIYIGMFIICKYNMFAQDEYNYSHIAWTNQKLSSFSDIVKSQIDIYKNWSGRIPVLGMVQVFLYIGKIFYDIINPIIFILFIIMLIKAANVKVDEKNIFIILLFSIFGAYKFWEKYIWISGSLNYLWPVTLMLIVIYYIYNMIVNDKKTNVINTIVLLISSFFAGWSHENVAFVLGSFIIFICLFNIKKILSLNNSAKIKLIASILLFGIGAILLIFCPGNFGRLGDTERSVTLLPVLKNILALYKIIILYIVTILILKKSNKVKQKYDVNTILKQQIHYFIFPIILALIPMIIIAEFPIRAALAYEVLLYILILKNLDIIFKSFENKKIKKRITATVILISILLLYSKSLFAFIYLRPYKEKIENQISQEKQLGKNDIIISQFENLNLAKIIGVYMDIFPKATDTSIINSYMSTYYDINTITAIEDGYAQIEIDIKDEAEITEYSVKDKNTDKTITNRIVDVELPMPQTSMLNRIIFNIPVVQLNNVYIDLPNNIKDNITDIKVKTLSDIPEINKYNLIEK